MRHYGTTFFVDKEATVKVEITNNGLDVWPITFKTSSRNSAEEFISPSDRLVIFFRDFLDLYSFVQSINEEYNKLLEPSVVKEAGDKDA